MIPGILIVGSDPFAAIPASFAEAAVAVDGFGREPVVVVEIDQDFCQNTYGVSPCTASGPAAQSCFNTFKTCQDEDNFDKGTKVIRFIKPMQRPNPEWQAIPSVGGVSASPGRINAGGQSASSGPLGQRSTVSVSLTDHPYGDIKTDPYVTSRNYNPLLQGTFWTKWMARNPYFQNRGLRVRYGYIGQAIESMQTQHYVMDTITGPDSKGMVSIRGVDILRLADDFKAQAPTLSPGALTAALNSSATSFSADGTALADYPATGTICIGEEVMTYGSRSESPTGTVNFSSVTRGTDGTTAQEHDEDDTVQLCLRYTSEKAVDIIYDLLTTYAGVNASLLDYTEWLAEDAEWLTGLELTTLITEPTGISTLIGEICEQVLIFLWWDDREQLVKLQAVRSPAETPVELTDSANVLMNSQQFKLDQTQRISQLWIYYIQANPTGGLDDPANFKRARYRIDASAEGANEYDEQRIKKVFSRWLQTDAQVNDVGTRLLARYRDNPVVGSLLLDAKDRDIWTGDLIRLRSALFTNAFGERLSRQFQVIGAEEVMPGEQIRLDLQSFETGSTRGAGRYTADDMVDYDVASDAQKLTNAWYSDDVGLMPDLSDGWVYQ